MRRNRGGGGSPSLRIIRHETALRASPIRGFEKYLIFYKAVEGGGVEVLRVLHGARDLPAIFDTPA